MRIAKNSSPRRIVIGWLATRPRRDHDFAYDAGYPHLGQVRNPGNHAGTFTPSGSTDTVRPTDEQLAEYSKLSTQSANLKRSTMTIIRRITATVLATVGTVLGLLAVASVAAASPVSPNDGDGFPTTVSRPPTGTTSTVVNSGSPWWTFVLVAAAAVAVTLLVALLVSRIRQHSTATQLAH
jgi:hypothetical protein